MSESIQHPRGIYTLFFTEMWERMSYYGMRALLTLFMVDQVKGMKLTDAQATAIYGLYTALVYVMALPGGWLGDRLLGMKRAVWWGGVVIALGHITLGIERVEAFYLGLVIVAIGSGLLKSNMSSMVGQLYPEGGVRRDAGYTLFYMGINVGAFIGMIICPWLAHKYGWRWGFSAAAVGMVLGLVQFHFTKHHIAHIGECPAHPSTSKRRDRLVLIMGIALISVLMALCLLGIIVIDPLSLAKKTATIITCIATLFFAWAFFLAGLTLEEKKRMALILVLFGASALFFAGFEQAGSSFSLFAERHTIRTVGSLGEIPAGQFQSLNSLMVIGLAPLVAMLWGWLARRNAEPRMITKFAWGLLALALGFIVAAYAAQRALASGPVLPTWLISIYLLHTLGELFLSPIGLSAVSKLAPQRLSGMMMGIWFLGSALGNILAGLLAGEVTGEASAQMPHVFMQVVYLAGASGIVLLILSKPLSKLMKGVHLLPFLLFLSFLPSSASSAEKPNIIFILSDDLAQGDLGCYGQKIIQTPNLDRMAAEGTRYLQGYCGTAVCAPSRSTLMTGLHTGHCPIRANREIKPEGQKPLPAGTVTVAQVLHDAGYATACCGKWGMGMFDTTGSPLKLGFDHFFGYNCQRHAHSYFPTYLYNDDKRFDLPGNTGKGVGKTYAQNLIADETLKFVREHQGGPFFLYYSITLPHGNHEIDNLGIYADKNWTPTQKAYAAQVTRLDSDVGRLLDLLKELKIDEKTLVMLAGDNGSSFDPKSEVGSLFNQASNGLRGFKRGLYEGALRQAALARWPGTVPAGRVSDEPWAFWDFLPTAAEIAGVTLQTKTDGLSLLSYLKGGPAPKRDHFYWELHEGTSLQALRFGDWKAVRNGPETPIELYDLKTDPGEKTNLASTKPDLIAQAEALMKSSRTEDPDWPLVQRKPGKGKKK